MQRMKLSVFVDVQNITNRKNPEEIVYSAGLHAEELHHRFADAGRGRRAAGVLD